MDGEVSLAFGFELTPLVAAGRGVRSARSRSSGGTPRIEARAGAHHARAPRHHQDDPARHGRRRFRATWQGLHGQYLVLIGRLKRSASLADFAGDCG